MQINRLALLPLMALGAIPLAATAVTQVFHCGMNHYVRSGGTELVSSSIGVRNADLTHPATILRLTIRDGEGNVIHDSGPATANPLPLNTDFASTYPSGKNITIVPPGGAVYLRSNHLWGNNGLPTGAPGNETGQMLNATLVVTKEGFRNALSVNSSQRMRSRTAGTTPGSFVETDTRATSSQACESFP
jgi:hypothetical protein